MDYYSFYLSCAGFNLNNGWFLLVGSVFKADPDGIIVIANKNDDNCTYDRIERIDKSTYKIFIKDIERDFMYQKVKYRFHIIYSAKDGKLLKQTLSYFEKSELSFPEVINL
jgi:hypothetical protein